VIESMRPSRSLASGIAARYSALPQVEAVALAGSQTTGMADQGSDLDIYVYVREEIPVSVRAGIAAIHAGRVEVDNRFWEPGDEWVEADSLVPVDVMFRDTRWIEEQLDRVLRRHEASVGYSTCFWYNVLSSHILYDRQGWFSTLQQSARQPYPEPLQQAIVAKNYPILGRTISSYIHQLERAVAHADLVSLNHRTAALLASYFDILLAVNRLPHPGEKRLVEFAAQRCAKLPEGMSQQVGELIRAVAQGDRRVIEQAKALVAGLDRLLRSEGLIS
jgi:predicted nucleotidyltransferase